MMFWWDIMTCGCVRWIWGSRTVESKDGVQFLVVPLLEHSTAHTSLFIFPVGKLHR
jgi:hypothetical protein